MEFGLLLLGRFCKQILYLHRKSPRTLKLSVKSFSLGYEGKDWLNCGVTLSSVSAVPVTDILVCFLFYRMTTFNLIFFS